MKRPFTIVVLVIFIGALSLSLLEWLFAPHHGEKFELKMLQITPSTNGSVQVMLLLTNGASVSLNVVDDSFGHPFMAYEAEDGTRCGITTLANMLSINLAPGKCLTNTVTLNNAPPKFRLFCQIRDLRAEMRICSVYLFMPKSTAQRFVQARRRQMKVPPPTTEWIELKTFTNQTTRTP